MLKEIEDYNMENMWFQQDGAPGHITLAHRALPLDNFSGRVVMRLSDVNWATRSCNLTPLDYFLWRHVKDRVHADNLQNLDQLKTNIRETTPKGLKPVRGSEECHINKSL